MPKRSLGVTMVLQRGAEGKILRNSSALVRYVDTCCCDGGDTDGGDSSACEWNLVRNCTAKSISFSPVLTQVDSFNDLSERWDHFFPQPLGRTHLSDGLWELVERELDQPPFYAPPIEQDDGTSGVGYHCFSVDFQSDSQMTFAVTFFGDDVELETGDPWDGGQGAFNARYGAFVFAPFLSCSFSMGGTVDGAPSNRIRATIAINENFSPFTSIPVLPFQSSREVITFPAATRIIDVVGTVNIGPVIELLVDNNNTCRERRRIDYSISMNGNTLIDSQIVDITEAQAQEFINANVHAGVTNQGTNTIPPQVKARLTDLSIQMS